MTTTTTEINVLAGLSADELRRLEALCRKAGYGPGELIFQEGDEGDDLYVVETGRVEITKAISLEVDRTLAVLGPGGVFGELAMVGEGARTATAQALEPTTILVLSRESFDLLIEREAALGLKVMGRFAAMLAERLRVTTDLLRDTVRWGLEVSGAASLDLHRVIETHATLAVTLSNGERVVGRLLKVEKTEGGLLLTLADRAGELVLLPYHAVVALRLRDELSPRPETA